MRDFIGPFLLFVAFFSLSWFAAFSFLPALAVASASFGLALIVLEELS